MITLTISDRLVKALCDTLLHSLWEGLSLAAIAGLIVICTRRASSALRYNLLVSALILFALGAPVTFTLQCLKSSDAPPLQTIHHPADATRMETTGSVAPPATISLPGFTHRASAWLNDHRDTIVMVWFLMICVRSLQLGVGLYGTYRLKRVRVFRVKDHWPERMQQLARSLGIRQTIALLESGLAKAPMMIGYLKPVILVPVGLLTALSPATSTSGKTD
jgi:bla regulator protein BlaR1